MNSRTAVLLSVALIGGCADQDRHRARSADDVGDDWEREQYATTNPDGDGSEGTAYYGAPGASSPSEPARRAASPEAVPARSSAAPRPAD